MKLIFYTLLILGCALPASAASQQEQELVIEMTGTPSKNIPGHSIWNKNARELTRLFRGKTKEYVLQTIDAFAAQEKVLTATDGTKYRLVAYGQDARDYRKFLFRYNEPQTFVTCAANAEDIMAIFQRYGVNLGVRKTDLLKTYPSSKKEEDITNGTTSLTVYKLPAAKLPLKASQDLVAVFENNQLVELFDGQESFEKYKKTLEPAPEVSSPKTAPQAVAAQPQPKKNKPYKALVSGGTLNDRMYMPHVNPKKTGTK